jgi:hypothetical protein
MGELKGPGRSRLLSRYSAALAGNLPSTLSYTVHLTSDTAVGHRLSAGFKPASRRRPLALQAALREDRNAARQSHLLGAREVEDTIADRQKEAENVGSPSNRDRPCPTADGSARFFQRRPGGVPEPSVWIVGIRRKVANATRQDQAPATARVVLALVRQAAVCNHRGALERSKKKTLVGLEFERVRA